ncbi:MAG: fasciclin domain-containing protein [Acidimicrobiia bacterium]|nr:fasciclin domain-containing protein [Acidimicrobiia bacterium]
MRRTLTVAMAALLAIALLAAPVSAKGDKAPAGPTIAEITDGEGFATLNFALKAAGLYDVLDGKGQYTVFAPTDDAFAALEAENPGTIAYLVANPDVLTEVLLYHVTEGRRWSNSVFNANNSKAIEMLNGGYVWANPNLSLTDNDSLGLESPDANVVVDPPMFNINAGNGVIHVIDQVLIP